jgi:hypothetical protein
MKSHNGEHGQHGQRLSIYTLTVIQTVLSFCNFTILLLVLVVGATYGVRIQNQVKVYWEASNVNPPLVRHMVNQTTGIIDNVYQVSASMVPIAKKTADVVTNATGDVTGDVTMMQAATDTMKGFAQVDWKGTMANASLAMGSVSFMNFSSVSDLIDKAKDPASQAFLKGLFMHFMSQIDFVTIGAASMFDVFKEGLFKTELFHVRRQMTLWAA